MKKRKAVWIVIFSGILLALSCVVLGKALVAECSSLNGGYSIQKVLVTVKNQIDRQGMNSFSIEDINRLERELSTNDISCSAQSGPVGVSVSNGGTVLPASLTGTDHKYPIFSSLMLEEGSFITQKQEEEGAMVAVIDHDLAWDMFNTVDVTGKTLDIYGVAFRIAGVVKKDDTLIGRLTDDGLPGIYIPAGVMLELDAAARITALQIKTADTGTLDQNTDKVSSALQQIGKNPSNYKILDMNLKLVLMEQGPLMLVFILGIISMATLLAYVKNLISKLYVLIRNGCRTDYFMNVIKRNQAAIGACMLETALALTGSALIWLGIRFRPYIPPQYVPDELINISYYSDLIKGIIQGSIQNMGYIAPRPELIVDTVNALLYLLLSVPAALGLLLLYTGFRELKASDMDSSILTIISGLFFMVSLAILAAAAYFAGMPFMTEIKSILVVWAFIYLNFIFTRRYSHSH